MSLNVNETKNVISASLVDNSQCDDCSERFDTPGDTPIEFPINVCEVPFEDLEDEVVEVKKEEGLFTIPLDAVEDLKYIAMGQPARLALLGYKQPDGFKVVHIEYKL